MSRWSLLLSLVSACGRYWVCDLEDRADELPQRLSETGLYADLATGELAADVVAYTPRYELWSDGADKRRWILLPEGTRIDSTDMDEWIFPDGTKVWKQFSVDGERVETRLLEKRGAGDDDWVAVSYVWAPDVGDAVAAPLGELDARGTEHDVPAAGECAACHQGRRSYALGFSAVQLSADGAADEIDLSDLVSQGRLTVAPASIPVVPGTAIEQAALGYLHANCSHCHNQTRPRRDGARCFEPDTGHDFTLAVDELGAVAATATYRTVVGTDAVKPGDPDGSEVVRRMGDRGFRGMPPLATAELDTEATALIRQWIEELP